MHPLQDTTELCGGGGGGEGGQQVSLADAERDPVEQQAQAVAAGGQVAGAAAATAWVQLQRELQIWFSYISCELRL